MSSVIESRGIQYSAEAAGEPGNLRCHVIRLWLAQECRAQYSIFVCNGTDADAQAVALINDFVVGTQRPILRTIIGRCSEFSTSLSLEQTPGGLMPEVCIALTNGAGAHFTLVIPSLPAKETPEDVSLRNDWLALPLAASPLPNLTAVRSIHGPPAPFATTVEDHTTTVEERPLPYARPLASPSVIPILLAFMAMLAAFGFFVARPRVEYLVVSPGGHAGTTVAVSYRATGLGSVDYVVLDPNGQTIEHGPLPLGVGTFALSVPPSPAASAYLVRLHVVNPIASASAEDYLRLPPPAPTAVPQRLKPPPAPPQIRSLALDRATLTSGETLTVYYDVSATDGSIALYDPESQITYGRSELAASGHSSFVAPRVGGTHFLTVIASAQRGRNTTQSRIAVTVTPAASPVPLGDTGEAAGDTAAAAPSASAAISTPATVQSGESIHVTVRGATADLELALLDGSGRELARHQLQAGQRSIDFTAPTVTRSTRFVLEGTYSSGVSSDTVVRAIVVTP